MPVTMPALYTASDSTSVPADGCRAYLYQNGSQYGNQSEEEDDEYFPQALVGQRPRPSRISIGEVEGRDADGEDGPAAQFDKGKGQQARSQQEEEANEHDCSVGEGSAGRHAHGSGPLFCIGVLGMVNGVIEKLQAIWRHRQEASVRRARDAFQLPVSFCTTMQPAHTGIREAVSVLGRAARKAEVMIFM